MSVSVLALESGHVTMWWITLGVGLVVAVVVVVLLEVLARNVEEIDRNVAKAWSTATRVARNTATTWSLQQTAVAAGVLRDEVALHEQLLRDLAGGREGARS